jgi:arylsulfatase A-like enzyme/tetratricopeptide (TPR) repeat protein
MPRKTHVSSSYSRGGAVSAAVLLLLLLLLGSWWSVSRPTIRREPGLNVLLITVDTLRADAVGVYGRSGSPTPWIDRLAQNGVRFAHAHAHNVITLPSHANLLTGRLPPDHGVRDNAGFRLPPDTETLATRLKAQGYRTAAFVSAFPLDSRFGLAQGFDVYDDRFTDTGPRPAFLIQERSGDQTVALARQWLETVGGDPWFCWVHLYEPHYPYEPPEPFASRWPGDPYAGEVAAADAALRPLLEPILSAGSDGRTLVVVTSDHGESLGEHGEATHGIFAYEAALRVPLVVYQPRLFRSRVVDAPAGHVDLLPTVLDALELPLPGGLAGRSLLPAIAGADTVRDAAVYFEALSGSLNRGWAPLFGLVRGGFKYIDLPIPELYDLRADPREQRNLADSEPGRVTTMRAHLDTVRGPDSVATTRPESTEARERLRSLGYIVGGVTPRARYTEEDDPKRLIALDTMLQEIVERYLAGDLQAAIERGRELVHRRPTMAVSWMYLAHLEREADNLEAAVEALRRAVALSPADPVPLALLGAYLTEAGRAQEAADLLEQAAHVPDADLEIMTSRALALARLGRTEAALATLARARAREPLNATLLVHVGTVRVMAEDRAAARAAFEEALTLNPDIARAHTALAVLALEDGRAAQAVDHWRAATDRDPGEYAKVLALGIGFDRAGRTAEARVCFEFFAAHAPASRYARQLEHVRTWLAGVR